jgi:hypothetical protein
MKKMLKLKLAPDYAIISLLLVAALFWLGIISLLIA